MRHFLTFRLPQLLFVIQFNDKHFFLVRGMRWF